MLGSTTVEPLTTWSTSSPEQLLLSAVSITEVVDIQLLILPFSPVLVPSPYIVHNTLIAGTEGNLMCDYNLSPLVDTPIVENAQWTVNDLSATCLEMEESRWIEPLSPSLLCRSQTLADTHAHWVFLLFGLFILCRDLARGQKRPSSLWEVRSYNALCYILQ